MKHNWPKSFLIALTFVLPLFFVLSCKQAHDLAITNVDVFDSQEGKILPNKTVLIDGDLISVIVSSDEKINSKLSIDGAGRLLTPGFIDTHVHLTDLYGDYDQAPAFIPEDSVKFYRDQLSQTYLNYGVTTIKVAGQPENWIKPTLDWQYNPMPGYPDIYISGGALISNEEREPYVNHVEVESPEAVRDKIQAYHDIGIRHLKLYWRLRNPEIKAAIQMAKELNMNVCGHIDQNVSFMDTTLALGLNHYEHVHTLAMNVFKFDTHFDDFMKGFNTRFIHLEKDRFFAFMMEIFRYVHDHPELNAELNQLIQQIAMHQATISTTIHLFAEKGGLTYFKTPQLAEDEDSRGFNQSQTERYQENFRTMMKYVKLAHEQGVKLVIGTDCQDGGKAMVSEMMLLSKAGFKIADILQIATINGAKSMDTQHLYGSIDVGKNANLVLFEKNPFDDYKNFSSDKTVIKDGKVYTSGNETLIN